MRKNLKRYTAMLLTVIMTAPGNTAYANIEGNYDISSGAEENGSKQEKSDKNGADRKKVENSENSKNSTSGSAEEGDTKSLASGSTENGDKKDTASGNTEDGNKKDTVSGGTEDGNKEDTTSSGIENGEKKDAASGDTENGDKKDTTSSGAESGDKKDSASGDAGEGGKDASSSENASSGGSSLKDEKGENGARSDEATDEEDPKKGQNGGSLSELEEEEEFEEEIEEVEEIEELQKASPSELEEPLEEERKILSWKWNDEQEALIDGELQLAVTEEDQITFEEIVSMLPESIQAKVSENGEKSEVEIGIAKWTCKSYQPDEEGKWPTTGEFFFVAELEEEYEMDENAGELQVKVTMEDPGVVPLDAESVLVVTGSDGKVEYRFETDGTGEGSHNKYSVVKDGETYTLTLNGIQAQAINLLRGTWIININSNNTLSGDKYGKSLTIQSDVGSVTFRGSGNLTASGSKYGISFGSGITATMEGSGIITAEQTGTVNMPRDGAALYVNSNVILNIEKGKINIDGKSYGLKSSDGSSVNITAGEVTAKGGTYAYYQSSAYGQDEGGKLNVTGGTLICENRMFEGAKGSIRIDGAGAKLVAQDEVFIGSSSVTLASGTLEFNGRCYDENNAGTFTMTGGTLTGTGYLEGNLKLPASIDIKSDADKNITVGAAISPAAYFDIPKNCGTVTYSISEGSSYAHIDSENGTPQLIADAAGTIKLKASSAESNFYKAAEAEVTLQIAKKVLTADEITVTAYQGTFDGKTHPAITEVKIGDKNVSDISVIKVEYAPWDGINEPSESDYSENMPEVLHASDSGKQYKVRISGPDYTTCTVESGEVKIEKLSVDETQSGDPLSGVGLVGRWKTYDGSEYVPQLNGYLYGDSGRTLLFKEYNGISNFRATWVDENFSSSAAVEKLTDAGVYHLKLEATDAGDFIGTRELANVKFTVDKKELDLKFLNTVVQKEYDATTSAELPGNWGYVAYTKGNPEDRILVELQDGFTLTYRDADAGTEKEVVISGLHPVSVGTWNDLKNPNNYSIPESITQNIGVITPAPLGVTGATIAPKTFDNTTNADVTSVQFSGLKGNDTLDNSSYTAMAQFSDPNAGTGKDVSVSVTLNDSVKNYTLDADKATYTLTDQTIQKAIPYVGTKSQSVSYSYGVSGAQQIKLDTFGMTNYGNTSMNVTKWRDDQGILQNKADLDVDLLTLYFAENDKTKMNAYAEISFNLSTMNYEDVSYNLTIRLTDKKDCTVIPEADLAFVPNQDDETFTAVIQPVDGAEYSFDGENWSDVNEKKDCLGGTSYTGYIRMKETEEVKAGTAASETKEAPMQTVKTPVVNPAGGAFQGTVSVEITCQTPDAEIYYTTDGSEPSRLSNRYTGAFTLSESAEVKAIAVKDHMNDSAAAQAAFEKQTPAQPGDSGNAGGNSGNSGSTGGSGNAGGAGNSGSTGGIESSGGSSHSGGSGGSGHSGGSSGSSSSSGTSTGPSAGQNSGQTTSEPKRGQVNSVTGIITGDGSGYSRWEAVPGNTDANTNADANTSANIDTNTNAGINTETSMNAQQVAWKLRYADGSYAQGEWKTRADGSAYEQPAWEMVNGKWYAFGADASAKAGWIHDELLGGWFYIDINHGMQTGWNLIDGKWYYFQIHSDGKQGIMYSGQRTPDGFYVDENGVWDGNMPVL